MHAAAGGELDPQVAHREDGLGHRGHWSLGFRASRSQSPSRLQARQTAVMARPGNSETHQALPIEPRPSPRLITHLSPNVYELDTLHQWLQQDDISQSPEYFAALDQLGIGGRAKADIVRKERGAAHIVVAMDRVGAPDQRQLDRSIGGHRCSPISIGELQPIAG